MRVIIEEIPNRFQPGGMYNRTPMDNTRLYLPKIDPRDVPKNSKLRKQQFGGMNSCPLGMYWDESMQTCVDDIARPNYKYGGAHNYNQNSNINNTRDSIPSKYNTNKEDFEVSTLLKPIDRKHAVLEAEKGEIATSPDLSNIYKIGGKVHSKGGTPLNLPNGSFIFSKDPSLAISRKNQVLMGLKKINSNAKKNNTPAKLVEKNIDLEHHNRMTVIAEDKTNRDEIAKVTANLMKKKNEEKLGQVAFLQESKKGEGAPAFANNTSPVYSPNVKNQIVSQNQYMRHGGVFQKGGNFETQISNYLQKVNDSSTGIKKFSKLDPIMLDPYDAEFNNDSITRNGRIYKLNKNQPYGNAKFFSPVLNFEEMLGKDYKTKFGIDTTGIKKVIGSNPKVPFSDEQINSILKSDFTEINTNSIHNSENENFPYRTPMRPPVMENFSYHGSGATNQKIPFSLDQINHLLNSTNTTRKIALARNMMQFRDGGTLPKYQTQGLVVPPISSAPNPGELSKFKYHSLKDKHLEYGSARQFNHTLNQLREFAKSKGSSTTLNDINDYQSYLADNYDDLVFDAYSQNDISHALNNAAYTDKILKKYNIKANPNDKEAVINELKSLPLDQQKSFILDQFKDGLWGQDALELKETRFKTQAELDEAIKGKRAVTTKDGKSFYTDPSKPYLYNSFSVDVPEVVKEKYVPPAIDVNKFKRTDVRYTNQRDPFNIGEYADLVGTGIINGMRKNFYPKRTEYTFTPLEMERVNPTQALQENGATFLSAARLAALTGGTPAQSNAAIQNFATKALENSNKIQSEYDTQNVGIANNQNQYNNQGFNTLRTNNVNANAQYNVAMDTVLGRINQDKREDAADLKNKFLGYYSGHRAMENYKNSLQQYPVVDPATGKQVYIDEKGVSNTDGRGVALYNTPHSIDPNSGMHKFNNVTGYNANTSGSSSSVATLDDQITRLSNDLSTMDRSDKNYPAISIALNNAIASRAKLTNPTTIKNRYGGYIKRK